MAKTRDIDPEIPGPEINPDKVCFIIVKARELEAEDEGVETDDSNATDDQFLSILSDRAPVPLPPTKSLVMDAFDQFLSTKASRAMDHVVVLFAGHGVEIDEALAAKYPYQRAYLPVAHCSLFAPSA